MLPSGWAYCLRIGPIGGVEVLRDGGRRLCLGHRRLLLFVVPCYRNSECGASHVAPVMWRQPWHQSWHRLQGVAAGDMMVSGCRRRRHDGLRVSPQATPGPRLRRASIRLNSRGWATPNTMHSKANTAMPPPTSDEAPSASPRDAARRASAAADLHADQRGAHADGGEQNARQAAPAARVQRELPADGRRSPSGSAH